MKLYYKRMPDDKKLALLNKNADYRKTIPDDIKAKYKNNQDLELLRQKNHL